MATTPKKKKTKYKNVRAGKPVVWWKVKTPIGEIMISDELLKRTIELMTKGDK